MEKLQNIEQGSTKMRLLEFLKYKNIKPGRFEKICGLANAFVRNMRKSIDPETFDDKIAPNFPELSKVWLLFGEGKMLAKNYSNEIDRKYIEPDAVNEDPENYNQSGKTSPDLLKFLKSLNTNSVEFGQIISVISQRMESNSLQIEILSKEISDIQGKLDKIVDALIPKKQEAKGKR